MSNNVAHEMHAEMDIRQIRNQLKQAFHTNPIESQVILSLLKVAPSSSRASDTTETIARLGKSCLTSFGEVDVFQFRQAIANIGSSDQRNEHVWIKLLHASMYGGGVDMVLQLDTTEVINHRERKQLFSASDLKGRKYWCFKYNGRNNRSISRIQSTHSPPIRTALSSCDGIQESLRDSQATLREVTSTVYHGSHPSNWLSIIHSGLKCSKLAVNGRAFGDGIYVAKNFSAAASFSPMCAIQRDSLANKLRIHQLCIVGQFNLTSDHSDTTEDGYIVVTDPNRLELVCLHVLAVVSEKELVQTETRIEEDKVAINLIKKLRNTNPLWVLLIGYVLWLVWIGQNNS